MDTRAFLGLRRSHNPYRWSMEATPSVVTTGGVVGGLPDGVGHGSGHGLVPMFAQDGALPAATGQRGILRLWKDQPESPAPPPASKEDP